MRKIAFLFLLGLTFVFQSCLKRNDVVELIESGEDQSLLENEFSFVFDNVDNSFRSEDDQGGRNEAAEILPSCAQVVFNASTKTLTIDFGSSYCLCKDGRSRKGKIKAVFTGTYRTPGSVTTVTVEDYFVKGLQNQEVKFEGTKTLTYLEKTSDGSRYSYSVSGAKAIAPNGTISWQTNATIVRTQGDNTLNPWDDVYTVDATSSGTNRRGMNFSVVTSQILKKKIQIGCVANFVSGVLVLTNSDGNKLTLNYDPNSDEACDKIATIQFNNQAPRTILLR
jgi:hypothetical protein